MFRTSESELKEVLMSCGSVDYSMAQASRAILPRDSGGKAAVSFELESDAEGNISMHRPLGQTHRSHRRWNVELGFEGWVSPYPKPIMLCMADSCCLTGEWIWGWTCIIARM